MPPDMGTRASSPAGANGLPARWRSWAMASSPEGETARKLATANGERASAGRVEADVEELNGLVLPLGTVKQHRRHRRKTRCAHVAAPEGQPLERRRRFLLQPAMQPVAGREASYCGQQRGGIGPTEGTAGARRATEQRWQWPARAAASRARTPAHQRTGNAPRALSPNSGAPRVRGAGGMSGSSARNSGGSSFKMPCITAMALSPSNGRRPVSISYRTLPRLKRSERLSTGLPNACSGDM